MRVRRLIFCLLAVLLALIVTARAVQPAPAQAAEENDAGEDAGFGYNMLEVSLPLTEETAGSAVIAEMNGYYLSRPATEKSVYTNMLRGKNLILICADNWQPDAGDDSSAIQTLLSGGVRFSCVYRPDWYQGTEGREFALLTGIVPTNVNGESSLFWIGGQDIYLPFTIAHALAAEGYGCRAYIRGGNRLAAYEAMGFSEIEVCAEPAAAVVSATAENCFDRTPFFAFYLWRETDGEAALSVLLTELEGRGLLDETVICLLTGGGQRQAQLFLYGEGLAGTTVDEPCSELDVTPTLLDLFGADYDSRFLSGRDALAPCPAAGEAADQIFLVSLYGSAYSDWVTAAGSYTVSDGRFQTAAGVFAAEDDTDGYAAAVNALVYDRYVFARRVMETNYFHLVFPP